MNLLNNKTLLLIFVFNSVSFAAVNDVFPTDYFSLPDNTNVATLYTYDKELTGPYAHSTPRTSDHLSMQIKALRLSHFVDVLGYRSAITYVGGYYQEKGIGNILGAYGSANGNADTRLGYTLWPYFKNGEHIALSTMITLPNGEYSPDKVLNVGENRRKYTFSTAWVKPIVPKIFFVDTTLEYAKYGTNNDYFNGVTKHLKLDQADSYALTSYARYRPLSDFEIYLGYQINKGGKTYINDISQNNPPNTQKEMLGVTWNIFPKTALTLRYGHENAIDNGFKTNKEIAGRLQIIF